MNKTYIIPSLQVVSIDNESILSGSITTGSRYDSGNNSYVGAYENESGETGKNGFGICDEDPD